MPRLVFVELVVPYNQPPVVFTRYGVQIGGSEYRWISRDLVRNGDS